MLPTTNVGPSKPRAPEPISDAASGGFSGLSTTHAVAPHVPTGTKYYTTQAQANAAIGPDEPGIGVRFAAGKGYYLGPTPNQAAGNAAAKTASSYQQYLAYLNSNMGRQPSLLDQLTQPIIQSYEAQAKTGDAAINTLTQQYATQLGNIANSANADYQTALGNQNNIDLATAQGLQGNLTDAANTIKNSLAMAGQDTSPATQAAANASSTAGSLFASGTAGVTALNQEAAAQSAYGKNLQGLANLAGIQAIGNYNAGLTQAESQAVSDAQKLIPSLMNAQTNQENADTRQAQTKINLANAQNKANAPHIYGSATSGYFALLPNGKNVQLTAPGQKEVKTFSSGGNEWALNPNTGAVTQITHNAPSTTTPKAPTTRRFPDGTERQWDGSKWVVIAGGGKGGGASGAALTPGEAQSYLKSISHTSTHKDPTTGKYNTTTTHTTNYQTAYKYLRSHGVGDVQARTLLDSTYQRGRDGRAWLTNEEQAVLTKAASARGKGGFAGLQGTQKKDILAVNLDPVSHHRFLSPIQYQILKSAGQLPPGAFQNTPVGERYYIAQ